MPGKGKHRRPKANPVTRGFVAAGTGGAALALPLMGATGAHAAGKAEAPAVAGTVAAPAAAAPAAAPAAPAAAAAGRTYTVVAGDHLSKIAAEQALPGGWQRLYADNREAVGADPSLIHPGLELTLGGAGERKAEQRTERRTEKRAAKKAERSAEHASRAKRVAQSARSAAEAPAAPEAPAQAPAKTGAAFVAPVNGSVSTSYRMGGSMWSSGYHTGVDFSVGSGTSVHAVGAGTVVSAGWAGAYGNEVIIRHSDGRYSQYAHLSSLSVSAGQVVGAGDTVGLSGSTGNSTGPHLHFEIRTGPSYGQDIDPLAYLRAQGVSI
ncbi:LysM peptidoglycan-binding domain-containing M23 family metallopeptidase [Streptomyces bambusae]|uniref:M23 family metallopeptidase n=1 Tax=Streptomyces bambusae TaxID=1550616 RepID=UPI001CFCDBA3|nr:M23 family metallopeptidase [Streptomyces bambusae]MCB5164042.1 LysM peptidoglycan-binding domain-containing M23 family metallopeptidase [Streptomyces bambusae]